MESQLEFKKIDNKNIGFLREMLFEALFVPEDKKPFPKSIIDSPEISKYIKNWDNSDDFGLIAHFNKELIGAIWGRLFIESNKGYGFIDINTPELTMAIKDKYRNQGIGTKLLEEFIILARSKGHKNLSLSVDKRNKAVSFYQRAGFEIVDELETAYTMSKRL